MEILGNICFSEQIFYRKQSLGAPTNHYSMKQELHFRLTFLAQERYCLLLSSLLLQVALTKSGSSHYLVSLGITKFSFRVKKIYKKKLIREHYHNNSFSGIFEVIALTHGEAAPTFLSFNSFPFLFYQPKGKA